MFKSPLLGAELETSEGQKAIRGSSYSQKGVDDNRKIFRCYGRYRKRGIRLGGTGGKGALTRGAH